jgi:N-methyl-L-tryptophan oxidase
MPPDRDLVIGPLPGHDEVLLALGAAHGFKFASVMGELIAGLVQGKTPAFDLSMFRMARLT